MFFWFRMRKFVDVWGKCKHREVVFLFRDMLDVFFNMFFRSCCLQCETWQQHHFRARGALACNPTGWAEIAEIKPTWPRLHGYVGSCNLGIKKFRSFPAQHATVGGGHEVMSYVRDGPVTRQLRLCCKQGEILSPSKFYMSNSILLIFVAHISSCNGEFCPFLSTDYWLRRLMLLIFNSSMEETFFFLCFQILEVQIDVLTSGATCKQGRRCPFSREKSGDAIAIRNCKMFVGNNVLKTFCHFLEARIDFADFQFLKSCLKILDAQIDVFISCANIRKHIFVSQTCYRRKLMFPFVCMANKSKLPKLFSMDDQLDAASSLLIVICCTMNVTNCANKIFRKF